MALPPDSTPTPSPRSPSWQKTYRRPPATISVIVRCVVHDERARWPVASDPSHALIQRDLMAGRIPPDAKGGSAIADVGPSPVPGTTRIS
jgi:hypothetical protein